MFLFLLRLAICGAEFSGDYIMSIESNGLLFWISLISGTLAGAILGPYFFPEGLAEVHGFGAAGTLVLVGLSLLVLGFACVPFRRKQNAKT